MSVRQRTEDAILLYRSDRHDGALLNMLVAVAATARKRRNCKTANDHSSFTQFVGEEMLVITSGIKNYNVRFRASDMPLQEFFYQFLRCELVHEGKLPNDVRFTKQDNPASLVISITESCFELSHSWLDGLYKAVQFAPENVDQFPEHEGAPDEVLKWFMFGKRLQNGLVEDYWKQRSVFAEHWLADEKERAEASDASPAPV